MASCRARSLASIAIGISYGVVSKPQADNRRVVQRFRLTIVGFFDLIDSRKKRLKRARFEHIAIDNRVGGALN
jgi:hypothetical protein